MRRIKGLPYHRIDQNGQVWTAFKYRDWTKLAGTVNSFGYLVYDLMDEEGNTKKYKAHRLVAEAYIGKTDGFDIHHIDENKLNNHYSNLQVLRKDYHSSLAKKDKHLPMHITIERDKYRVKCVRHGVNTLVNDYEKALELADLIQQRKKEAGE